MNNQDQSLTASEKAYELIKSRILGLAYKPGRGLSTASLAEELGMSRSPIRDALLRLANDNLIETFPKSGSRVSLIDLAKVTTERFLRTSLEKAASSEFALNNSPEHIDKMRDLIEKQVSAWETGSYVDFVKYDDLFHRVIFEAIGMQDCWEIILTNSPNDHRIRLLSALKITGTRNAIVMNHTALVDAAEKKNRDDFMRIESQHLSRVVEETAKLVIKLPEIFKFSDYKAAPESIHSNIRSFQSGNENFLNSLVSSNPIPLHASDT
ncbi:GntR family transcriptional regulator [uncultured Sphaerochaeta sp.]|uniref:GntR family transcriptional regulator n=1 Tax=uncultured Sphaerochaeta sp. TaxID=886478 RepID=UPI0029C725C3|nr:GntR family transcriptional regulator [uncultured Sphaerochaeta sp.]